MVHVRVSLPGLRDAQTAGRTFFLGASGRVFPEEISIGISRLDSSVGGCHPIHWGPENRKVEER